MSGADIARLILFRILSQFSSLDAGHFILFDVSQIREGLILTIEEVPLTKFQFHKGKKTGG